MKTLSRTICVVLVGSGIFAMQGCNVDIDKQGHANGPLHILEPTMPDEQEEPVANTMPQEEPEFQLPEQLSDGIDPAGTAQFFQPPIERNFINPRDFDVTFDDDRSDEEELDAHEAYITIVDPDEDLGSAHTFVTDAPGQVPVYMIGVERTPTNETGRGWTTQIGHAEVHIESQDGPFVLVLSGRSPIEWHLSGPGVADVERLVTLGLRDHRVVAPDLEVEPESPRANFSVNENQSLQPLHWWPADDQVCREGFVPFSQEALNNERVCQARRIQTALDEFLGAPVDIFSGTVMASEFIIH